MSLAFLMLAMIIFATIFTAALVLAPQVPAVREDLAWLTGNQNLAVDSDDHGKHFQFILFTLTSPLILAGLLSTGVTLLRWSRK